LFLGAACGLRAEDGVLVRSGQSIAFMGDSITDGGWGQAGGYVRLVVDAFTKKGIKITPIPAGVSGHKSTDMLARLDRDVITKKPDWMTLSCGVNDVMHGVNGVELDKYKQNIASIVNKAKAAGINVVILTSTPIGEEDNDNNRKLTAYNEFLRELAKDNHLQLADLSADFQSILKNYETTGSSRYLTVDGVHMNPNGNVVMAKGCLSAFGFSKADIENAEQSWLKQPNSAVFNIGNFDIRPNLALTLSQYRKLDQVAKSRNVDLSLFRTSIWLQATGEVIQGHANEPVLDPDKVNSEITTRLASKIEELVKEVK